MSRDAEVLFANEAFYIAFATRDLKAMGEIWSREHDLICVHPGWPPLYGRDLVMKSWAGILGGPAAPRIRVHAARAHFVAPDAAFVTCWEILDGGTVVATNVFLREGPSWRLIHHHGSPGARPPESLGQEGEEEPRLQ